MNTTLLISGLIVGAMLAAPITSYAGAEDYSSSSNMDSPSTSMDSTESAASHSAAIVKESAITTKIIEKLAAENVGMTGIQVDTDKSGTVWLSGTAKTQAEADKVVTIAKSTAGVVNVKNNLRVKSPA